MDFISNAELLKKIFDDRERLSNEEYVNKLITRVEILTRLSHSLHVDGIQMPTWKTFSETIIIKICFHISSLFQLYRGTEFPFEQMKEKVMVFDEPSIYSLFRTITENYLTFYYLFIDSVSEEEKYFRFIVYEYCGFHQRQSFSVSTEENKKKKLDEALHLEKLKEFIINSPFFKSCKKNIQEKILIGIQPRLRSWKKLINDARLSLGFNSNLYGFKSSYTHTEYISLLQIKSGNYGFRPHQRKEHFVLFLVHMLISRMIIDLCNLFPSIKDHFIKIDKNLKEEIEFLSENLAFDINPKDADTT